MPGASLPALFLILQSWGILKRRWRPPPPVREMAVIGFKPYLCVSVSHCVKPSCSPCLSRSMAIRPDLPQLSPMLACGAFSHQRRMMSIRIVASFNPCGVSGVLSRGLIGKTYHPALAYSSACWPNSDIEKDPCGHRTLARRLGGHLPEPGKRQIPSQRLTTVKGFAPGCPRAGCHASRAPRPAAPGAWRHPARTRKKADPKPASYDRKGFCSGLSAVWLPRQPRSPRRRLALQPDDGAESAA